jgi:heme/copper-type cytochrome/quinol oxidase subunit 4
MIYYQLIEKYLDTLTIFMVILVMASTSSEKECICEFTVQLAMSQICVLFIYFDLFTLKLHPRAVFISKYTSLGFPGELYVLFHWF